jgi:hypothetical protein
MIINTKVIVMGNNTGIEIKEHDLLRLGGGKKPLIKVTINGYTYRSSVGKIGLQFLISLSKENREKANIQGGEELDVEIQLDTEPRIIEIPKDVELRINQESLMEIYQSLAPSKKKAVILQIQNAKTEKTRNNRIQSLIEMLHTIR